MKHIVNFSGGLCSFWAAHRVIQRHGKEYVTLLFADTLEESPDLYEFNAKASQILGVPITRISEETDVWALFRREGLIGNNRFPICSVKLKRDPLDRWCREHCLEMDTVLYVGFDWNEDNRVTDLRKALAPWRVEAPMMESPIWTKEQMENEAIKLGLQIPELYRLGFPHNNCGGRCVRAGITHWVHLFKTKPERYLDWEQKEWDTAEDFRQRGIVPLSILRDRRNGETRNLYLKDLRTRIEAGEDFPKWEWGGCGCGGAESSG